MPRLPHRSRLCDPPKRAGRQFTGSAIPRSAIPATALRVLGGLLFWRRNHERGEVNYFTTAFYERETLGNQFRRQHDERPKISELLVSNHAKELAD